MSLWQTKNWQEFLLSSGQSEAYFEIDGIFFEKRKISFGNYGLFGIGVETELHKEQEKNILEMARNNKCLFAQIEYIKYDSEKIKGEIGKYYKKFIAPYTVVINLQKSEDEILADMKPKGRYNIKLAREKGVECRVVEKTQINIKKFYGIFQETTKRDEFSGNTYEYYENFLKLIPESNLMFAYYQEQVIAAGIFVLSPDVSLYYYGASSSSYREVMAPYLLQWTAIMEAKKQGSKIYDFLGVALRDDIHSPLAGVTQFKTRLQAHIQFVSGSKLLIVDKKKYFFVMMLRKLRGILKK